MPQTENNHGERISKLEEAIPNLTRDMAEIKSTNRTQNDRLEEISGSVSKILTASQVEKGKIDVKTLMGVGTLLGGFWIWLISMYINPIQSKMDSIQTQLNDRLGKTAENINSLSAADAGQREQLTEGRIRAQYAEKILSRLDDESRQRLSEEAAIGRTYLYSGSPKPKAMP